MNKLYILIFYFLFIVINNQVKAEEITTPVVAYSKVDKTKVKTGDVIQYEINIDYDKRLKPVIPDIKKNLGDFSITEEINQPVKNIDNRKVKTFIYKIQAKEPGSYIIQPVIINYSIPPNFQKFFSSDKNAKTSKIYIEIKSILKPEDKGKEIDDIKDIEDIQTINYQKITLYVFLVFILIALIFWLFKIFRKPKKPLLPHEWAFKEISQLEKDGTNQKKMKPFYFKISEILRVYLEKRFNIQALQMTNYELENILKHNEELTVENKSFINSFIQKTDFYKFTDSNGDYDNHKNLIKEVSDFVDHTKKLPEKKKK